MTVAAVVVAAAKAAAESSIEAAAAAAPAVAFAADPLPAESVLATLDVAAAVAHHATRGSHSRPLYLSTGPPPLALLPIWFFSFFFP